MNSYKASPEDVILNRLKMEGRDPLAPSESHSAPSAQNNSASLEPGKDAENQPNEPGRNPEEPREQTGNGSSEPGNSESKSGKSKRAPFEPATGPRGFLNTLPPETQEEILEFLEDMPYWQVILTLAQPPPNGLGVKVSQTSLKRFYDRHKLMRLREQCAAMSDQARAFINDPSFTDDDFTRATNRLLRVRLLEYARDIRDVHSIRDLAGILDRIRRTDLSERRLKSQRTEPASNDARDASNSGHQP